MRVPEMTIVLRFWRDKSKSEKLALRKKHQTETMTYEIIKTIYKDETNR